MGYSGSRRPMPNFGNSCESSLTDRQQYKISGATRYLDFGGMVSVSYFLVLDLQTHCRQRKHVSAVPKNRNETFKPENNIAGKQHSGRNTTFKHLSRKTTETMRISEN